MFKCLNLVAMSKQEVYVIVGVHQAILLVPVEFKLLGAPSCVVRYALVGHVNGKHCLRILGNSGKDLSQEILGHYHGEHEVVEFVLLVNVGKETAHHDTEPISRNRPSGMLTTGTTTKVLARN